MQIHHLCNAEECLTQARAVLITHKHPAHFDAAGSDWVRTLKLPVWAYHIDPQSLHGKSLGRLRATRGQFGVLGGTPEAAQRRSVRLADEPGRGLLPGPSQRAQRVSDQRLGAKRRRAGGDGAAKARGSGGYGWLGQHQTLAFSYC